VKRSSEGFVRLVTLVREKVPSFDVYPFKIPAIKKLETLKVDPRVTFLVGDDGSGKSTLIEEGGSKNFKFSTRSSESELHKVLRVARGAKRERDGFFLRAESYFNVATEIEKLDEGPGGPPIVDSFGGVSAPLQRRWGGQGRRVGPMRAGRPARVPQRPCDS